MTQEPVAVLLPAGCDGADAGAAAAWFREVSGGHGPLPSTVSVLPPRTGWGPFADRGGKGRWPANSQSLAAELLAGLDPGGRDAVAASSGRVLMVVPDGLGFEPHTWRLRGGGHHLGGRRWARRYAVVPSGATLGTWAHELGHLVYGWPDLDRGSRIGRDCLMAAGGHHPRGGAPAPPCAPLRVDAGWDAPDAAGRGTRVSDLAAGVYRAGDRRGGSVLVEGRPLRSPPRRILVFADDPRPRLVGRVAVGDPDLDRPLLAVIRTVLAAAG